jgi:hypothetical protein
MSYLIFGFPIQILLGLCRSINKTNLACKAKDTVAGEQQINHCKWTVRLMVCKRGFQIIKTLTKSRLLTGKIKGGSV